MPKRIPVVGETLYSLNVGNAARGRKQVLTPVTVLKVGRKYFTAGDPAKGDWTHARYSIDTWHQSTRWSADSVLYESEQEWEDERESQRICKFISERFSYGRNPDLSLMKLKEIEAIVNGERKAG